MADLTPLNLIDSLETFLSLFVFALFQAISTQKHSLAFQFTTFVDKPKFSKYFSVICLPYLFRSLVYQTLYNFKIRVMKEFSNGPMDKEGDEIIQQWTNYNSSTRQQEY